MSLKEQLKKFSILVALKRHLSPPPPKIDATSLDVLQSFPLVIPYSAGSYEDRAAFTIRSINETFPKLRDLSRLLAPARASLRPITTFATTSGDHEAAAAIKVLFDQHGSDKANSHNYHFLYGPLIRRTKASAILEVGLGTNNTEVVSTMGPSGRPGASLRAFRDFTEARVYGADIDRQILFTEDRIETFFVDQTDTSSLRDLSKCLPTLDLVIDDGLHSPDANLATLAFGLSTTRQGGWVVVEDIGSKAIPLWEVVAQLLPPSYECHLLEDVLGSVVFAVKKGACAPPN